MTHFLNKLFGDPNKKEVKRLKPNVEKIKEFEKTYEQEFTHEEQFQKKTQEFKNRIKQGENVNDILPEAFALLKCACRKNLGRKWDVRGRETEWDMVPFDVQLIGGIVLHQGKIAEMKTGEGKTLVCTLPVYLNALTGKGVFVVTVNEYLAHRDAEWMGGIYRYLGLKVGVISHVQNHEEKKKAYECDIIYGTNSEFGFDYLRDNMATDPRQIVQRNLHYAIVDEVDSILIDEARTPLIISAPAEESTSKYQKYSHLIANLQENKDYNIDEKSKTAVLSEQGIKKMEELLGVENIYTEAGFEEVHHIEQALKAKACYLKDIDYVVKDGEILIVDEFTGRLMPGRRYSDGLHQAIEAKENVEIKRESRTLATVSLQNYFRLFNKLAGMTGTAETEAEEFYKIYGLDTVVIPTHRPVTRQDLNDLIYKNQKGKFIAIAKKVQELHEKGQPVLVGTISIEKSEILSKLFQAHGIPHNVLNAKHHEKEAEIIARAGEKGAVTIATNMAGRGTDIKLGAGVKELGGLVVMGTERHESRRIDNQLRGRSGRQGDPGISLFYVSMEDDLMRVFGGERVKAMMEFLKVPEDMPIENKIISRSIESAQKRVEGHNFDIRKHLVQYDDVMNKHREIIYSRRRKILESENIKNDIILLIEKEAEDTVLSQTQNRPKDEWNYEEIFETINAIHKDPVAPLNREEILDLNNEEDIIEKLKKYLLDEYIEKEKSLPDPEIMRQVERNVYLQIIDTLWMEHIDGMSELREAVSLQGYGQKDPLIEYKQESYLMLKSLLTNIQKNTVSTLFKAEIRPADLEYIRATLTPEEIQNLQTNENQIESTITGSKNNQPPPKVIRISDGEESTKINSSSPKEKAGRNDPCPCGSGKKYKKCCGR